MKKVLFALLLALQSLWASGAAAAPCITASLTSYQSLGAGGCTIGALLFTDFSLNGLSAGAVDFPGIVLTPINAGAIVGLDFAFTPGSSGNTVLTAASGTIYEDRIGFKITGTSVGVATSALSLNGAGTTDDGNVSTVQDLCLGGTFVSPTMSAACSAGAKSDDQAVVFISGVPDLTTSMLAFAAVNTLSVINDIVVDAGTAGTAMLVSVSNRFSSQPTAVAEPESILLIGVGLMALLMRRPSGRKRSTVRA